MINYQIDQKVQRSNSTDGQKHQNNKCIRNWTNGQSDQKCDYYNFDFGEVRDMMEHILKPYMEMCL